MKVKEDWVCASSMPFEYTNCISTDKMTQLVRWIWPTNLAELRYRFYRTRKLAQSGLTCSKWQSIVLFTLLIVCSSTVWLTRQQQTHMLNLVFYDVTPSNVSINYLHLSHCRQTSPFQFRTCQNRIITSKSQSLLYTASENSMRKCWSWLFSPFSQLESFLRHKLGQQSGQQLGRPLSDRIWRSEKAKTV